jgi:hypothetical protein
MKKFLLASFLAIMAMAAQPDEVHAYNAKVVAKGKHNEHDTQWSREYGEVSLQTTPGSNQIPVGKSRITYNNLLVPAITSSKVIYKKKWGTFKVKHSGIYTIDYRVQAYSGGCGMFTPPPGFHTSSYLERQNMMNLAQVYKATALNESETPILEVSLYGTFPKSHLIDQLALDANTFFNAAFFLSGQGKVTVRLKAGESVYLEVNKPDDLTMFFGSPSSNTTAVFFAIQRVG